MSYNNPMVTRDFFEDQALEDKFYRLVSDSFDSGVLLNRASFGKTVFHFLQKDATKGRNDVGKPSYARWFESQPKLGQQGDGIVSFCTIVSSLLLNERPLMLLDEPEAFLHPPQVRSLAKIIAEELGDQTQLIISTHSHDFIQALIDYESKRVSVVRLSREKSSLGEVNRVKMLDPASIADLWHDPLLRISDVLTSLFHHVAIIVEGDSDARFFRAMFDSLGARNSNLDIRFFHCGGKDRIYRIASALRAIGVPVICIVDIDILDDGFKFKRLFEAFGGISSTINDELTRTLRYVETQRAQETVGTAIAEISELLRPLDQTKAVPANIIGEINYVLKKSSAWSLVKRSGENFFNRGAPYNDFRKIFTAAGNVGIFINPYGELENLCKSVEARKSEWLAGVLLKQLDKDPELETARAMCRDLIVKCRDLAGMKTST